MGVRAVFIGDKFKTNCSSDVEVVGYENANKILVRFDDGVERYTTSGNLQKGKVKHPSSPIQRLKGIDTGNPLIGERRVNSLGHWYEIVKYINHEEVEVRFDSGYHATCRMVGVRSGEIRDFMSPTKERNGVIGVGVYEDTHLKYKREHTMWVSMIRRVDSPKYHSKFPTYIGSSMCDTWRNFQVFAEWCNSQKSFLENPEFVLDKDILVKGNKLYSPTTCTFVPASINSLFTKCDARRGCLPIGVYLANKSVKYASCVSIDGVTKTLGYFTNPEQAFLAYKEAKETIIKQKANKYIDRISSECFSAMMNYEVEITD